MSLHPYIAIEGAIGVGKTTLARILSQALPSELLLEVFEENPFLGDFYADRARYAFQTQIFFLLSRYRQQHRVIAGILAHDPLVSDYLFAKDWLFAHLNLAGDELQMYERVHSILGEQIPAPSLVVYLRATTDTLMRRIAFRDRSYERQMERDYLEALQQAYDHYFADYTATPLLVIDTDGLDIVQDPAARMAVVMRIKNALQSGSYQLPLLEADRGTDATSTPDTGLRLQDFQRFQRTQSHNGELIAELLFNYISLTEKIGSLGHALRQAWQQQDQLVAQLGNRHEAYDQALGNVETSLEETLAGTLALLLQIANNAAIDLEAAYLKQIRQSRKFIAPEEPSARQRIQP